MPLTDPNTSDPVDPMENGVQQVYQELRSSLELILAGIAYDVPPFANQIDRALEELDDAVANHFDDLMWSFWRGVRQDIDVVIPSE